MGASTLFARVAPEAADLADKLAERVGVSKAEFVEALLLHAGDEIDDRGVPTWWTKPVADQEGLDLMAS